jgi:HK97 family phage portal protein
VTVLGRLADGSRAIQALPWGKWQGEDGGVSWAGPNVDNQSSLQLLTVYGCNRFICEGISTLPVDVLRDTPDGAKPAAAPPWLQQPTPELNRIDWLTQILTSLLLDGNAYCRIRRGVDGIEELEPLNPSAITPFRRTDGRKGYRASGQEIDPFQILHIPAVMFPGELKGMSPIEAARQTIGKGLAVEEFAARFFGQGANQSGVIEAAGEVTDDQAKFLARQFAKKHSGLSKAHLPAVLPHGLKWQTTGVTNEQAQFLQTQQFTAAQIAAFLFLIDPTEFGVSMDKGSSVTYANLEQRNARKVQVTFLPWIVRLEMALSALIRQSNRYMKFNVSGLLRADTKTRYETHAIGIASKFLLPNEAREKEDLPRIPGGDKFAEPPPVVAPPTNDENDEGDDGNDD